MSVSAASTEKRFNLPLPFGWFAVARSKELAIGDVKPLQLCSDELVLWRGNDGVARALDAVCPHLGAHLGHGGVVVENNLRCPFHHWQFKGDGGVAAIPYAESIPESYQRPCDRAWHVYEGMDMIFVWWHPQKSAPLFELEPVAEIEEEGWVSSHYAEWTFDVHIQEINENSSDIAHFIALHGIKSPPVPELEVDGYHRFSTVNTKFPTAKGDMVGKITVRAPGPGVSFTRFWGITDLLLLQMQTPLDGGRTQLRHLFFHPEKIEKSKVGVTKKYIENIEQQLEEDAKIWPYKHHLKKPMLVKGDGPIMQYRQYYKRFYVEESPESGEENL